MRLCSSPLEAGENTAASCFREKRMRLCSSPLEGSRIFPGPILLSLRRRQRCEVSISPGGDSARLGKDGRRCIVTGGCWQEWRAGVRRFGGGVVSERPRG